MNLINIGKHAQHYTYLSSILFRTTSLKSTLSALTANLQTKGSIVASVLLPSILTLF